MRTFFITLLLVIVSFLSVFSQPKYEIRATWLTTLGGMDWPRNKAINASGIRRQQKELCDILDRLKAANFNTVLLQTRLRGDMIYPSAIETFAESLTGSTGGIPDMTLWLSPSENATNEAWNYMHGLLRFLPEIPVKYNCKDVAP